MIFRRYTTLLFVLVVLGFSWTLLHAGPYINNLPVWQGVAQGSGANYPPPSSDRTLLDLDGNWQSYNSLQAADSGSQTAVVPKVYGTVSSVVYGKDKSQQTLTVPGSWRTAVVVKQFVLSNDLAGRNFRLQLLSLGNDAEVFINGFTEANSVGQIAASNVPVSLDIPAPRLKFGQINTIAIRLKQTVNNGPWLAFPGLTGDVYLQALGQISLASPQLATTLKANQAQLNLQIPYQSTLPGEALTCALRLVDTAGQTVAAATKTFPGVGAGTITGQLVVPNAHLWSPQAPYLYTLEVTLTGAGGERDSYTLPVGLRQLSFNGKLMLNGTAFTPKILQRVNDAPESGGAADPAAIDRDLAWAKSQGYNVILIPDHTPQPYMWDAADRQGFLVLSDTGSDGWQSSISLSRMLAQADKVQGLFGYHASFLAQGIGNGLDLQSPQVLAYLQQAQKIGPVFYTSLTKPQGLVFPSGLVISGSGPYLADFLAAKPSFQSTDYLTSHLQPLGILDRQRKPKTEGKPVANQFEFPIWLFWLLGCAAVVLLLRSWALGNLRWADLQQAKPKRKLRLIIRLQLYWFILRWAILALIAGDFAWSFSARPLVDYMIERLPEPLPAVLWYLMANPLELTVAVFVIGIAVAWLLTWPRARSFPQRPGCTAVLLWLEKRKRWLVPVLGFWLWAVYGGPYWPFWLALGLGLVLSAWLTAKDLKNSGGKTFSVLYLAGLVTVAGILIICNWEFVQFVYHWSSVLSQGAL